MAQEIPAGHSVLFIKRDAYERSGITRQAIDKRLNLMPEEFRVDGRLIVIGPLLDDTVLRDMLDDFETAGLSYFDDYFELSGNWPTWLRIHVSEGRA